MRKMISVLAIAMSLCLIACEKTEKQTDKPVLEITNPKPCHTGRIIVYEQGETVFDYYGDINLINDGRNGEEIAIIVGESNQ